MSRTRFLDLARLGLRMPIGTDLILRESLDPEGCKHDGTALGQVVEHAANRYATPLAFPLMDLTLEKADLLEFLGVRRTEADRYHFDHGINVFARMITPGFRYSFVSVPSAFTRTSCFLPALLV